MTKFTETLRGKPDCELLFLTDEEMCIDKCGEEVSDLYLVPQKRERHREIFRRELSVGIEKLCIHFFGKMCGGSNHDFIFIWKVPAVHGLHREVKLRKLLPSAVIWHQNRWPFKLQGISMQYRTMLRMFPRG